MIRKKYSEIPIRNFIFITIIIATIASWIYIFDKTESMNGNSMGFTMGMSIIPFLVIWTIMMVAMMFPSVFPMVASFEHFYISRYKMGKPIVPVWVFLAGYTAIWILFGFFVYWGVLGISWIAKHFPQGQGYSYIFLGILFIVAGVYQVTPFKNTCLGKCRSPMEFIRTSWREGYNGAFVMGFVHGLYCLGCCWLLFLLMFPIGLMNITAMGVLALIIFSEKTLSLGTKLNKPSAIILIFIGITIILSPNILRIF
ncbi:DUF2182 domain-containing protein [Candidatus Pacearchaeota archaeon]|nr:DUF2182 domain-containing protein [Candidatus Pacearchaeota archaeon]